MKVLAQLCIILAVLSACAPSPTRAVNTPFPTTISTKIPTSTWTPRPVTLHACVTDATIRVRSGPGTEYEVIGGLVSGTCMSIASRNEDASWVYMVAENNITGWVASSLLTIEGNVKLVTIQSPLNAFGIAPTQSPLDAFNFAPTATRVPLIIPTNTAQPVIIPTVLLCSNTASRIGEYVTCKIPRRIL